MTNHNQGKLQKHIEINGQILRLRQCIRCNISIYKDGPQKYEVLDNNLIKHNINRCLEAQKQMREVTNTNITYHRVFH